MIKFIFVVNKKTNKEMIKVIFMVTKNKNMNHKYDFYCIIILKIDYHITSTL